MTSEAFDTIDPTVEKVLTRMASHGIGRVEALSAHGFKGLRHGQDGKSQTIILSFPSRFYRAYQTGKSLVAG